ncbi:hypothetical protein ACFYRI_17375 [Streptomyces microflavus]|uniref:hypothetical protein n=1 Tax=Streptomyces microflavus TaxID=1919 RepID=UPI0036AAD275
MLLSTAAAPDIPHEAFDSLFEQRVYLALRARGYRAGAAAVSGWPLPHRPRCRGRHQTPRDAFHTEENADADAARQRELERVGWTFVRIRGSRFFLDPERALEPLWAELDGLGIEPAAHSPAHRAAEDSRIAPTGDGDDVPTGNAEPALSGAPSAGRHDIQPEPSHGTEEAQPRFVTVARLHRDEVNAAQHGFSTRATVPGTARFLGGSGCAGLSGGRRRGHLA